jgi:hypothetical protein
MWGVESGQPRSSMSYPDYALTATSYRQTATVSIPSMFSQFYTLASAQMGTQSSASDRQTMSAREPLQHRGRAIQIAKSAQSGGVRTLTGY